MNIRNDSYTEFNGKQCRLFSISENTYRLQADLSSDLLSVGFRRYDNIELNNKVYIDLPTSKINSAYFVNTLCKYQNGRYYIENAVNNKIILNPDDETKKKLGLHIYDDRRIEIEEDVFLNNVSEIWEERRKFEDFNFVEQPLYFVLKNS